MSAVARGARGSILAATLCLLFQPMAAVAVPIPVTVGHITLMGNSKTGLTNGKLSFVAVVNDTDHPTGTTLFNRLLANQVTLDVADGGSYVLTNIQLKGCRGVGTRAVTCRVGALRVSFVPFSGFPSVYIIVLALTHLGDETGTMAPTAPITFVLHQDVGFDRQGTIGPNCRTVGRILTCRP